MVNNTNRTDVPGDLPFGSGARVDLFLIPPLPLDLSHLFLSLEHGSQVHSRSPTQVRLCLTQEAQGLECVMREGGAWAGGSTMFILVVRVCE